MADIWHIAGLAHVPTLDLVIKTMKIVSAPENQFTVHAAVIVAPPVCHNLHKNLAPSANHISR